MRTGLSGSAVSPHLSGWSDRPGIFRPSPAQPPCFPGTGSPSPPLSTNPRPPHPRLSPREWAIGRTFELTLPLPEPSPRQKEQPQSRRSRQEYCTKNPTVGTNGPPEAGTPRPPAQRQQRPSGNTRGPSWRYTPRPLGVRASQEQDSGAHRVPPALCRGTETEGQGTQPMPELQQAGESRPITVRNLR